MKKTMITVSILILIGLTISTIYNQNSTKITPSPLNQTIDQEEDYQNQASGDEEPKPEELQPVSEGRMSYSLQNDELNLTFNGGIDWVKLPIEKDALFAGEYRGNEQELIEDSYVLKENRVAFLYSRGAQVVVAYSVDQGQTWQESMVTDNFEGLRFRKIDFLDEQFGYVVISGGRTMSSEYSIAYLTHDGGATWEKTADPPTLRLIADGGFVDEATGFLSYGTINPQEPDFYVTQDSGNTWETSVFLIPEKYQHVFVQAEMPFFDEGRLSVLVNQGPSGDYQGGLIKGKFVSDDNGMTWEFLTEVEPNETEQ